MQTTKKRNTRSVLFGGKKRSSCPWRKERVLKKIVGDKSEALVLQNRGVADVTSVSGNPFTHRRNIPVKGEKFSGISKSE